MKKMSPRVAGLLLAIIASLAVLLIALRSDYFVRGSSARGVGDGKAPSSHGARSKSSHDRELRDPSNEARLRDLIRRWDQAGPSDDRQAQTPERQAIVREAVEKLLCSPELIDFIKHLEEGGYPSYNGLINSIVGELLRSGRAGEVRSSLVSLVQFNGAIYTPVDDIIQPWVMDAGRTATPEDIETFCDRLAADHMKLDALGAYNLELAKTKPYEAAISTLEKYGIWKVSGTINSSFEKQLATLPDTADFASIEKMVPKSGENSRRDETLESMRSAIFRKWSEYDPAGAANYIMENSERLDPKYVGSVAEALCTRDQLVAVEWAQTFPDGPYYDHAVGYIVVHISQRFPKEAIELANRVETPELRERIFSELRRVGLIQQ